MLHSPSQPPLKGRSLSRVDYKLFDKLSYKKQETRTKHEIPTEHSVAVDCGPWTVDYCKLQTAYRPLPPEHPAAADCGQSTVD
jgi:hypothetical protein